MKMKAIMSAGLFAVILLVILGIVPNIESANTTAYNVYAAATQNASMIALGVIMPLGGVLISLLIIASTGIFSLKIAEEGFNFDQIILPIGRCILGIVLLNFYSNFITSINSIIAAETVSYVKIIWGAILLAIYLGIIVLAGGYESGKFAYKKYKERKSGKKPMSSGYAGAHV